VAAPTVKTMLPVTPPEAAEIVTVPAATAVTRPVEVTLATLVFSEVQVAVAVTSVSWPCALVRVAWSWVVCPATMAWEDVTAIVLVEEEEEEEGEAWPPHPLTSEAVHANISRKNVR